MFSAMTPAWPVLLVLLAAPGSKAPAPKPAAAKLAVIDVEGGEGLIGLAGQVTRALLEEAKRQNLAVLTPDEIRAQLNPKQYEDLRKCRSSGVCVAQYLQGFGATRAVVGQVGRDERHYTLKLWLYDLATQDLVADVDRQVLIAARRFQKDVEQAVPPLLRGEREARGTLNVESNVNNTQVTMEGEFIGTAPLKLVLKPGKYEVKVERNKYLPISRFVIVEANQTTTQTFQLLLKPGELPDDQVMPALVRKDAPKADDGAEGVHLSAKTWIAGALTLAGTGVGLYFGLSSWSGEKAIKASYDPLADRYGATRRDALLVQQNALGADIAFGVAGAAAVATVIFIILDAAAPPEVQVAPTAGPGGAGVLVGGRF